MSVMQIHNLIHTALLVAGNVIWLQPGQVHMTPTLYNLKHFMNVHLPFSVYNFVFPTYFVLHYCRGGDLSACTCILCSMEEIIF